MEKTEKLYEGKAKKVFRTEDPDLYIISYKDDATAFNGEKKGTIQGKGVVNNLVSNHLMKMLEEYGVPTHFVEQLSDTETLVKRVNIIPIEVIVRNIAAGSLSKRLGIPEGSKLSPIVIEYCYKNDELGDPLVNEFHIEAMGIAKRMELSIMSAYSERVNSILGAYLKEKGLTLVDFKLEFGKLPIGKIILADEFSPDTCRLWDEKSGAKLDKDRFRQDLGGTEAAYGEVRRRLLGDKS